MPEKFKRREIVTVPSPTRNGRALGHVIDTLPDGMVKVHYIWNNTTYRHEFLPSEVERAPRSGQ